jgi:superfamily II DNA helicase RecQ
VDAQPRSLADLSEIAGIGPAKLERYGDAVLALLVPS